MPPPIPSRSPTPSQPSPSSSAPSVPPSQRNPFSRDHEVRDTPTPRGSQPQLPTGSSGTTQSQQTVNASLQTPLGLAAAQLAKGLHTLDPIANATPESSMVFATQPTKKKPRKPKPAKQQPAKHAPRANKAPRKSITRTTSRRWRPGSMYPSDILISTFDYDILTPVLSGCPARY